MRQKDRQKNKGKYLDFSKELIEIVEVHGGAKCRTWGQVARHLEAQVGVKIEKAYRLKRAWESFVDYDENMNDDQLAVLFETALKSRGNMVQAKYEFKSLTGIALYSTRYADYIKSWLKPGLLGFKDCYIFSAVKSLKRTEFYQKHTLIQPITVLSMLRILDHSPEECLDYFSSDFRKSAEKLLLLLQCYTRCFKLSRTERFSYFSKIVTRKQFKRIYFYLQLMEEFRRINRYYTTTKHQLTKHPMLLPSISENKSCMIYKLTLMENDYPTKLNLFNESNTLNDQFSVLLKPKKDKSATYQLQEEDLGKLLKVQKDVCQTKKKYKDYKYFRGHFIREGQYQCKGLTTKDFDYDVEI